jgi:hypothetical protein
LSLQINEGHFGDVALDGLRGAAIYHWPGAVHEGNGRMRIIVDERADARRRDALVRILSGQNTEDMAAVWWVFGAMSPTKHPPLFHPITFDVDVDARRARVIDDIRACIACNQAYCHMGVGISCIQNPVTGRERTLGSIAKSNTPRRILVAEAHEDGGMSRPPSKPAPRRAKIDKAAVEIDAQTCAAFVGDLKQKITAARHRAGLSVNRELVLLYWTI